MCRFEVLCPHYISGIDTEVVKPWDFPPQNLVPPLNFYIKKEGNAVL